MFDAGAIIFKIQAIGAEVFHRDIDGADQAVKKLGTSAEQTTKKVAPTGDAIDKTGKAAKAAKAPLEETAKSTKKLGDESDAAAPKVKKTSNELAGLSDKGKQAATTVGVTMVGIGAAVAGMAGVAVSKFAEFDQAVSGTQAATHASAGDMAKLSAAAIKAGADTAYSATEAANAETELAKAGVETADILSGGLKGSLALAAAGQLGVADAASIAATTLKQFNLTGDKTEHVADLLAAGAGKAQGSVQDLAGALQYVGPVAANLGISVEETTGSLALFASQGQIGMKAGTGLRGVLMALTSPTKQAADVMEHYNVQMFDGQGKFIGMSGAAQQLQKAFGHLSDEERSAALGQIFGNEQITAATVLYKGGAKGVDEWTDSVNEAGYAALTAGIMQNNLAGDVEKLGGSFDTAMINTGAAANGVLRDMVQVLTVLVDWYGALPGPVQSTALAVGIGTAAVLLFGGAVLIAVPKIAAFRTAVHTLSEEMPVASARVKGFAGFLMGPWGIAIGIAIVALTSFATAHVEAEAKAKSYEETLDDVTGAVTDSSREIAKAALATKDSFLWMESDSPFEWAKKFGIGLDDLTDAALGQEDALKKVNAQIAVLNDGQKLEENMRKTGLSDTEIVQGINSINNALGRENAAVERGKEVHDLKTEATDKGTGATEENADATKNAADAYVDANSGAEDLLDSLMKLLDVLDKANGTNQDAITTNNRYKETLDEAAEQLKKNKKGVEGYGQGLDDNTEAGRRNLDMLTDIAAGGQAAAKATYAADGNTKNYKASLEASHKAVYDQAIAFGATAKEAQRIADNIAHIPSETEWKVIAETKRAQDQLAGFMRRWDGKRIDLFVDSHGGTTYRTAGTTVKFNADGGRVSFYADGGRENHVAQFARAGSMRVWAEDETEGEWYIPAAKSKRPRSTQVLAAAANEFGYQLVPVQSFADGGRHGSAPSTPRPRGGVSLTFVNPINVDPVESIRVAGQLVGADLDV